MKDSLHRARARRDKGDRGSTMIELVVGVVIIGVLVAIAVPVYMNYRKGAANKSAESDVRGAVSAVEQYYTENGNKYPNDATGTEGNGIDLAAQAGLADRVQLVRVQIGLEHACAAALGQAVDLDEAGREIARLYACYICKLF